VNLSDIRYRQLIPFTTNKGSTNIMITFFDIFNLTFGSYFFIFSLMGTTAAAASDLGILYTGLYDFLKQNEIILAPYFPIFIGLGIIPLSFSVIFFLLPLLRTFPRLRQNEKIRQENLRKKIYSYIHENPLLINPGQISPQSKLDTPKNPAQFIQKQVDELAGIKQAEFEEKENKVIFYNFNEIKREQNDIAAVRKSVDLKKYDVGETVFDSGE